MNGFLQEVFKNIELAEQEKDTQKAHRILKIESMIKSPLLNTPKFHNKRATSKS